MALHLYKVLSTSFEDAVTREALQTLLDLYMPPSVRGKEPAKPIDELKDGDDTEVEPNGGSTMLNLPLVKLVPGEIATCAHIQRHREEAC